MTPVADEEKTLTESPPAPEGDAAETSVSPNDALVDALRRFVHQEAQQPAQPQNNLPPPRLKKLQAIILLVIVLDIVLLYGQFQELFENPLFKFALQAVPWLLGATAFAYSDSVRKWVLEQCKHPVIGAIAVFVALPLLIVREPVFSAVASVPFASVAVVKDDPNEKVDVKGVDATHVRITVPDLLKVYRVKVADESKSLRPKDFPQALGRWRMVVGTIEQFPLIKQMYPDFSIPLTPLYSVMSQGADTQGTVIVEGPFGKAYLAELSKLSQSKCAEFRSSSPHAKAISCRIQPKEFDAFPLPPGKFTVLMSRDGCKESHKSEITIPKQDSDPLSLDDLCAQ